MIDIEIKSPFFLQMSRSCLCLDGDKKKVYAVSYI